MLILLLGAILLIWNKSTSQADILSDSSWDDWLTSDEGLSGALDDMSSWLDDV